MFTDKKVAALFYNEQTTGPQTQAAGPDAAEQQLDRGRPGPRETRPQLRGTWPGVKPPSRRWRRPWTDDRFGRSSIPTRHHRDHPLTVSRSWRPRTPRNRSKGGPTTFGPIPAGRAGSNPAPFREQGPTPVTVPIPVSHRSSSDAANGVAGDAD